ncbi:MAG: flavodoxin family protein [Bacillota bacterium]
MKTLVVYYSRTGTTDRLAKILKSELEASLLEIKDQRKRRGFFGLIRSGFDAITANVTVIEGFEEDLTEYDLVLVGSPVWAGQITPAIRTFLIGNSEVLPEVAFFLTHGGGGASKSLEQLEELAEKDPVASLVLTNKAFGSQDNFEEESIKEFVSALQKKLN